MKTVDEIAGLRPNEVSERSSAIDVQVDSPVRF